MSGTRRIDHGGVSLALHERRGGAGDPLLLLHALAGSSTDWGAEAEVWPGPVVALDFAGHGESTWRPGGAYTPELFVADADAALGVLGTCAVAGAGLGAYVALLLAGARPALVRAALLLPGRGLAGGGPRPTGSGFRDLGQLGPLPAGTDPLAAVCEADVRPPDYACAFAEGARTVLLAEDDGPRPPWWEALRGLAAVDAVEPDPAAAFVRLAVSGGR